MTIGRTVRQPDVKSEDVVDLADVTRLIGHPVAPRIPDLHHSSQLSPPVCHFASFILACAIALMVYFPISTGRAAAPRSRHIGSAIRGFFVAYLQQRAGGRTIARRRARSVSTNARPLSRSE